MLKNIYLNKKYQLILINLIKKNKAIINSFVKGDIVDYSNNDFNFYEFNKNFYVLINNSNKDSIVKFNLGFPFPVCFIEKKMKIKNGKAFSFYFKGEELRSEQRNILKNIFSSTSIKSVWKEYDDIDSFRKTFDKKIKTIKLNKLIYVDPYSFIGDSFIGMHFIDGLIKKYKFNERIIFSKSSNHMSSLGEVNNYDESLIKESFLINKFLVFPDLLDINFEKTISLLNLLVGMSGLIVLPGRSIFIELNKNKVNFYHLNQEDIILRNQNIEDYMNDCMRPFIKPYKAYQDKKKTGRKNIFFINPFGSLSNKTLDADFVFFLCQELSKRSNVKINIIAGLKDCSFHQDWIKKFISLKEKQDVEYNLSYYQSLNDLALDFYSLRPGALLTADTSISHLANRINLPNIIFFHTIRFDNTSLQSMISESPLGFGRYFKNSYPVLIERYENYLPGLIANFLFFLADINQQKNIKKKEKLMKDLENIFPEEHFYSLLPKEHHKNIKKILKKISPIVKLKKI